MKRIYLIMLMIAAMMVSCKPEAEKATVETREVTDVTSGSAKILCNISDDGGAEVSSRGVCWDTSDNPTVEMASSIGAGSGIGNYECEIDGLESNTTYYVRAYATNSAGISYGGVKNFTTLGADGGNDGDGNDGGNDGNGNNGGGNDDGDISDLDGEIAGYGYVDLGLPSGLKWATCNVGATSAEDYGDYFAWGETSPKTEYNEDNSITHGEQMSDISGNAQYDAAAANWGGSWRMPTEDEMQELIDHCEWEWTQVNGVYGSKVTGPNGSCIFLPAAGCRDGSSLISDVSYGFYWSSTPGRNFDDVAYYLSFYYGSEGVDWYGNRYCGLTVRPITE